MTVKEAIEILEKYTPDMEIFMDERSRDFKYGPVTSIKEVEIGYKEDPGVEILSRDLVLISSDR